MFTRVLEAFFGSNRANSQDAGRARVGVEEKKPVVGFKNTEATFRELAVLPSREDRIALLTHQLSALVKEHVRLPFHSYALIVKPGKTGALSLHDLLYAHSDVLERCERAIEAAQSAPPEAGRYSLEKKQVEHLLQNLALIGSEVPSANHNLLNLVTQEKNGDPKAILQQLGWQRTTHFLSVDQAHQLATHLHTDLVVGPKFFYIMPQSAVHDGALSMYIVAQPAFFPAQNRWVVLQEQLFLEASWEDHGRALARAQNPQPPTAASPASTPTAPPTELEVMGHCIKLSDSFHLRTPRETLISLAQQDDSSLALKQSQKMHAYLRLEESIRLHADYLTSILELEEAWGTAWDNTKVHRLDQAFFATLSSLFHTQPISQATTRAWYEDYKQLYQNANNRKQAHNKSAELRGKNILHAPWLSQAVSSNIECFSFSALQHAAESAVGNTPSHFFSVSPDAFSTDAQLLLQQELATYQPLRFSNGETWYIPQQHVAKYASGCAVKDGVVFGPCDIPLTQDSLVLSEGVYQKLQAQAVRSYQDLQTGIRQHLHTSLSPEKHSLAKTALKQLEEKLFVRSYGLQNFISGDALSSDVFLLFPLLLSFYNRLILSDSPLVELQQILLQLETQNPHALLSLVSTERR